MTGRIVHFEVPFDDKERAHAFYKDAFGWGVTEMPEMGYTIAQTGPVEDSGMPTEPGYINGGMYLRDAQSPTSPVIVIDVPDIDAALVTIEKLGGTKVVEKMPVGEMGFAAYFTDTEGNTLGLWETAAQAG